MAVIRAIGAILAGALFAFVLGAIYEYLPDSVAPDPSKWQYLYPWLMGITGLLSSLVATLVFYPAVRQAQTRAALRGGTTTQKAAAGASTARSAGPAAKSTNDVPGMPSFDFEAAKRELAREGTPTTSTTPASQSGSIPAAPLAPGSPSGGSRPEGSSNASQSAGDKP